jgi:FixJ family two-component response regulator
MGHAASFGRRNFSVHPSYRLIKAMVDPASVVFVVDDDASIRDAVRSLLKSVGLKAEVFASPEEFLAAPRPDIASCMVLDVELPGMTGLEFQEVLEKAGIRIPIVFVTAHGDIPMTSRAMKAGAVEFLTKPFQKNELLTAIHQALDRDRSRREEQAKISDLLARYETLTIREREVMDLVVAGLLNKQAAAELGVSEITVKIHRGRAMQKMQADSLADLVKMSERLKANTRK